MCQLILMAKRTAKHTTRKSRASTEQVLGAPTQQPRIPSKWARHYRRLTELRDDLLSRQVDLTIDAMEEQPTFSTHMADAGTDTYDRDFALGMLSNEQDAVYQIEQAMDRIRQGTYGVCELTGKKIEPERLEAIPWTRFSAAAERQLEKEGVRKHAALGARDEVTKVAPPRAEEEEAA